MARPEPWQLEPASYPVHIEVPTRFGDLDPLGHINNVAIADLFETGRIHFHRRLGRHPREEGARWLVAALTLNYLAEGHFPAPIAIATGFSRVGTTSWTLTSAAFQSGQCIATCETVMVAQGPGARDQIAAMATLDKTLWYVSEPG